MWVRACKTLDVCGRIAAAAAAAAEQTIARRHKEEDIEIFNNKQEETFSMSTAEEGAGADTIGPS